MIHIIGYEKWNKDSPSECFNFTRKIYLDNKTSTCKHEDHREVSEINRVLNFAVKSRSEVTSI